MKPLTGKQKRHLRSLAQSIEPVLIVGRDGVTGAVLRALEECFHTHELVKVRLGDKDKGPRERDRLAGDLASGAGAHLVQVLGRVAILYRPAPADVEFNGRLRLPE